MTALPPIAILAGGLATRMRPLTEKIPKALIDLAGKPFIVHQVELLKRCGFSRVVLCIGFLGEMIEAELGDGSRFGLDILYSPDGDTLLGTGGAVKKALPLLGETFFITYGDGYLETDSPAIAQRFAASGKDGLMVVYRNEGKFDTSNVIYRDGQVLRYDKTAQAPEMRHIDYGVQMLRASVLADYPAGAKFDIASVYGALVERGQMAGYETDKRFYEIGSPQGLAETAAYIWGKG